MALTLRQLQYFVTIVEMGNITHAAERLHVAPTAVSLQVKAMEDRLGVALLERHSRGVSATAAGRDLFDRARRILELVDEAERAAAAAAGVQPVRQLRVGAPPAVARVIGVEAILAAAARKDRVALQVTEGWTTELVDKLQSREVDLVIGYGLESAAGLRVIGLFEERFVFAAAPGVGPLGGTIRIDEALAGNLVFYGERSISWRQAQTAARELGLAMRAVREVESIDVWRKFLLRGLGTAITPFGAVAEEFRRGELVVQEIEGPPIHVRLSLATRDDADPAAIPPGFLEFLAELVVRAYQRMGPYYRPFAGRRPFPVAPPVAPGTG
ncbi:MAG: LysR family transcriptional regulator [Rhodobacteraceae bacterium]|jgi:LysR family nitrogen assimilation transcriptional regulator|nr:LysR family transcriptional regulator [Paracoccaceae bacterium]